MGRKVIVAYGFVFVIALSSFAGVAGAVPPPRSEVH